MLAVVIALGTSACGKDKPAAAPLVVLEVQPTFGDPMGGKVVQITGSGFDTHSTVQVTFGARPARAVVVAKDRIQLESPAGKAGEEVEVTVTFPDGRSAKAPQRYRWIPADGDHDHDHDGSGSAR